MSTAPATTHFKIVHEGKLPKRNRRGLTAVGTLQNCVCQIAQKELCLQKVTDAFIEISAGCFAHDSKEREYAERMKRDMDLVREILPGNRARTEFG